MAERRNRKRLLTRLVIAAGLVGANVGLAARAEVPNAAEVVDPSFALCGSHVVAAGPHPEEPTAALVQPDGKVVVMGTTNHGAYWAEEWVVRFTPLGGRDPHFGDGGGRVINAAGYLEGLVALALQPDGKILMGGKLQGTGALVRLTADGDLDPTFGAGNGIAGEPSDGLGTFTNITGLEVEQAGTILAVHDQGSVSRFDSSGAITMSAPVSGVVDVAAHPDGTFFTIGNGMQVRHHLADGTLDSDYGIAGATASSGVYIANAKALRVEPDGAAVAYGLSSTPVEGGWQTATVVGRWLPSGVLDTAYGSDGYLRSVLPAATTPDDVTIRVEEDGSAMLTIRFGQYGPDGWQLVVRLGSDGALDPAFGEDGAATWDDGAGGIVGWPMRQSDGSYIAAWRYETGGTFSYWTDHDAGIVRFGAAEPASGNGGYVVDGWGGLHSFGTCGLGAAPRATDGPYWTGWDIVRGVTTTAGGGGLVLDGWGGLHQFSTPEGRPAKPLNGPYWVGWDIARGLAATGDNTGYIVDGWGGTHPFSWGGAPAPPRVTDGPYWVGWDIVRDIAVLPDGTGGYILDGWGGLHPFAIDGNPLPPEPETTAYWEDWDIARGVTILPSGMGGYVADAWGGLHPFAIARSELPPPAESAPYWTGWDIVRGVSAAR